MKVSMEALSIDYRLKRSHKWRNMLATVASRAGRFTMPRRSSPLTDFVIVYELKTRELESIVLLGEELKRRGYSVDYLKFPVSPRYLVPGLRKRARLVVIPAAYDENTLYMMVFRGFRAATKVVNLQWEQVWTVAAEADRTNFRIPQGLARLVTHACWGQNTHHILSSFGIDEGRLPVTGPIHMDFFGRQFSDYYRSKASLFDEFGLSKDQYTVLFISTFSYTTLTAAETRGLKSSFDADDVDAFRDLSIDSKTEVLKWIANLLEIDPSVTVIYRPHPAEKESSELFGFAAAHRNFHVIGSYSIGQWIQNVDKIYTWYSTSIGEVFYGGKSCEILRPLPVPLLREVAVMRSSRFTESCEEFLAGIHGETSFPVPTNVMQKYYDVDDARPSYWRTATMLEGVLNGSRWDLTWPQPLVWAFRRRVLRELMKSLHAALFREFQVLRLRVMSAVGRRAARAEESRASYLSGRQKLQRQAASGVEFAATSERMAVIVGRVATDQASQTEGWISPGDACPL